MTNNVIEEIRCALAMRDAGYAALLGSEATAEILRCHDVLVKAMEDISLATVEGRVCDDVAWFDEITTLHDFCEITLDRVRDGVGGALS